MILLSKWISLFAAKYLHKMKPEKPFIKFKAIILCAIS